MNCRDAIEAAKALLLECSDDPDLLSELLRHIKSCSDCNEELAKTYARSRILEQESLKQADCVFRARMAELDESEGHYNAFQLASALNLGDDVALREMLEHVEGCQYGCQEVLSALRELMRGFELEYQQDPDKSIREAV